MVVAASPPPGGDGVAGPQRRRPARDSSAFGKDRTRARKRAESELSVSAFSSEADRCVLIADHHRAPAWTDLWFFRRGARAVAGRASRRSA